MIARRAGDLVGAVAATDVQLYDASDVPWIAIVVDHVMGCLGQPWRVLREQLEHAPVRSARVAAILGAMRRMIASSTTVERARVARKVRARVLGHPALDDDARALRLARAGEELGIDPSELEDLLWIDLADERPVTLPDGRPDETRLAAYANVDRIQRILRRARHVRIHAWGNANALIRTAARYGLLVRVSAPSVLATPGASGERRAALDPLVSHETNAAIDGFARHETNAVDGFARHEADNAATRGAPTILDIIGPLSLFHQTQVYGRALGSIVPHLSRLDRFIVEIDADAGHGRAALRVVSPALLPPVPIGRGKPSIATRIATALERVPVVVERDPAPIAHGIDRLFPDLALEVVVVADRDRRARSFEHRPARSRCWFVEVVGFATSEYLAAKLARYEAAGIERVLLVVDATRDGDVRERRVVPYSPRTIARDLLGIVEGAS